MAEAGKTEINFGKPFLVIKIHSRYKGPYRKPRLYLDKKSLKTKKDFISYLNYNIHNWNDGMYTLKCYTKSKQKSSTKLFARFRIKDNKVVELMDNPHNKKKFLCWEYFKD